MTKKRKIILVSSILVLLLISFFIGQAYAKYFTKLKGEGVAEIASWDFKVNGQKEQVEKINLNSTMNNESLIGNKIAPGTEGSFNIVIDATGTDVGINYNIEFSEESNKPTNLKFTYDEKEYNSIEELTYNLSGVINANDENKERTLNIKWKWDYETGETPEEIASNDEIDTREAANLADYTFNVTVSDTQVQPN